MSRLFLSHSSADNAKAVAIHGWLAQQGWSDVFLDLDPNRGIEAGERWERALHAAASRCEAVLFLVSRAWLASRWCLTELHLARRLNKRLFGVLIEDIPLADLPPELTGAWQVVALAAGQDHVVFRVTLPKTHEEAHVTFSKEGLARLRGGLAKAGLDPQFFAWPPADDPDRPPYRGLKPLEAEDAGIFFGRDAPIVEALDALRGLADKVAPRLFVVLGASGAGKSSFLRAGLLPRLARDDRHFLTIPVIRPERSALTGETGLVNAVHGALTAAGLATRRADVREAAGAGQVPSLLRLLVSQAAAVQAPAVAAQEQGARPPLVVIPIDQAEELFLSEGAAESASLLEILRDLLRTDNPGVIVLLTIRSDSYDRLETAKALEGLRQETLPLLPMPRGAYQIVIEGPPSRLDPEKHKLVIESRLTQRLLRDIDTGSGSDALPLLAFTLEQLYADYGSAGALKLADYESYGGIKGAIEAAVERALAAADKDPAIPRDRLARLALLRRGLIPWLAGIDPETGSPRRRIARLADVPKESLPLIRLLLDQRLLATDRVTVREAGETRSEVTIEPAHEALLRQWGVLRQWLEEDRAALTTLDSVKRAAGDWIANQESRDWLNHSGRRLEDAERVARRHDLASDLSADARRYLARCRAREKARGLRNLAAALALVLVAALTYAGLADSGVAMPGAAAVRLEVDHYGFSIFRPVRTALADAQAATPARDEIITRIHREWVSGAWVYDSQARTLGPKVAISPWISSQAMCVTFRALSGPTPDLADDMAALDAPFAPGLVINVDGKPSGWLVGDSDYLMAEPALWTVAALAVALSRRDLVPDDAVRAHLQMELDETQSIADLYRPIDDGGWNLVPQQNDPEQHATYTTALAFLSMLELRRANLFWHDDPLALDAMLRATAAWLATQFDAKSALPGWHVHLNDTGSADAGAVSDGMTLQIYSELLRAEDEASIPIPAAILAAIPRHLDLLLGRPSDYADSTGVIQRYFTNIDGQHVSRVITENYLWYPWAIECATRWLRRLDRVGGSAEAKVAARRVLGYLLVDLGARNIASDLLEKDPIFVDSETLYALATALAPPAAAPAAK